MDDFKKIESQMSDIIKDIQNFNDLEETIIQESTDLTIKLMSSPKKSTRINIAGTNFRVSFQHNKEKICVYFFDEFKLAMANLKYMPAMFQCEIDKERSFQENLYGVIYTAVAFEHDYIKVDELEE